MYGGRDAIKQTGKIVKRDATTLVTQAGYSTQFVSMRQLDSVAPQSISIIQFISIQFANVNFDPNPVSNSFQFNSPL